MSERDDLIRMATQAGFDLHFPGVDGSLHQPAVFGRCTSDILELFAAVVRADERRKHQADIELWKGEAAKAEKWRAMALAKDPMQPGKAVQEIQREAAELERSKRLEAEGMAECMDMVRQELIAAGVINDAVPPMMLPEAILGSMRAAVAAEREACAQALDAVAKEGYFDPEGLRVLQAAIAAIRARSQA